MDLKFPAGELSSSARPPAGQTILIVDDSPENLTVLAELLQPLYRVRAATSGSRALRIAGSAPRPDLILLDVMMPDMDGHEVFKRLREDEETRGIPVIFVTGMDSTEAEIHGLEAGAADYIVKPFVPPVVLARVRTQLELKLARDWQSDQNSYLEAEVASRIAENEAIQEVSIRALAHLAEIRDPATGDHILRTQTYVHQLAVKLRMNERFAPVLNDRYIKLLTHSAPLHDIGKVGIPDAILRKPGRLTPDEWEIMKTHARLGNEAITLAERHTAKEPEFLRLAKEIAHRHHEKWDGTGYPDGLQGNAIPVSARIMALADVFDALVCRRVYKVPMSFDQAREIIVEGRGRHFDPDMADIFLNHYDTFCDIARRHRYTAPDRPH